MPTALLKGRTRPRRAAGRRGGGEVLPAAPAHAKAHLKSVSTLLFPKAFLALQLGSTTTSGL